MKYTCCFTGHRKIPHEHLKKLNELIKLYISFLAENGVITFLAGGAVGFDLMCASLVLSLKEKYPHIRLEIVLPSPDYDKFFPKKIKIQYSKIFQKADDIVFISKSYTKKSIFLRNMYMVDKSAFLICYCTKQEGGSFFSKSYAQRKKLILYNVLP